MFRKQLERGEAGDNLGALLRNIKADEIKRGQVPSFFVPILLVVGA